jgi:hypothetical protein
MVGMASVENPPLPEPEASLDEARRLILDSLGGYPAEVYLFGSRAWGGGRAANRTSTSASWERALCPSRS